jgi:hypothetical protein
VLGLCLDILTKDTEGGKMKTYVTLQRPLMSDYLPGLQFHGFYERWPSWFPFTWKEVELFVLDWRIPPASFRFGLPSAVVMVDTAISPSM